MFGYVRPVLEKLSPEEQDRFQSVYCGLCHALGQNYGPWARLILNYDFTFLALVLMEGEGCTASFRCPCKRFCRKTRVEDASALRLAADDSVILTYWKLRDEVSDRSFRRGLGYRALAFLMRPAYRKAAARQPRFAETVETRLAELREMERSRIPSIDRPADAFASILAAAVSSVEDAARRRILEQMLYHLGRWIYLVDALDDLKEDAASGAYNPLICRFTLRDGALDDDSRARLIATLDHSVNRITSAYLLAERSVWSGVLENIIYFGLPGVGRLVLDGKWNRSETRRCSGAAQEKERMEFRA